MRGIFKYRGCNIWYIRYADIYGKIRVESSGSDKHKDAETKLTNRKAEVRNGRQPETVKKIGHHSFQELKAKYLEWIKGRQKSADTKGYIIGQLSEHFGNLPLRRFSTLNAEEYQTKLIRRGLKAASINKVLGVLKHMIGKAVEWELVEDDTLKRVRKVKPISGENKRLRFLTIEECHALIHSCDAHLKPIVITALNTGMRRGEMLGLRWENVDLKHGFILLDKTKNGERREIPINGTLKATLQGITRRLDIPHVYYDPSTGKPYKDLKRSFAKALKKAEVEYCTKCEYQIARLSDKQKHVEKCPRCGESVAGRKGIDDFHFHDLRHTFASHLIMSGADLATVKELLGHKDIKMTLRYSHLAPAHKKSAVDVLDRTFAGRESLPLAVNEV